jgi:hypothetical protein
MTSSEPINPESRELLGNLRDLLLEQHKLLLDRERASYEKINGPIPGPGAFLTLVLSDPHFAWLRQISTLIVEIDEATAPRSQAGQDAATALIAQTRELMKPRAQGNDFQYRYYQAVQDSPDVVILQCRLEQLLENSGIRLGMDQIDVDQIAEVNYLDDPPGTVDVIFKDGSTRRYNGAQHPDIFATLNHWTPPTA